MGHAPRNVKRLLRATVVDEQDHVAYHACMKAPKRLTPVEAVRFAKSQTALAKIFDPPLTRQAVAHWVKKGEIPNGVLWELLQLRPGWFKASDA